MSKQEPASLIYQPVQLFSVNLWQATNHSSTIASRNGHACILLSPATLGGPVSTSAKAGSYHVALCFAAPGGVDPEPPRETTHATPPAIVSRRLLRSLRECLGFAAMGNHGQGPGEGEELFDFAKDALSRVSHIAVDLGARKKLCVAGCLAAELLIAKKALDSADAAHMPRLQRRVPKLLDDLDRVCAVSDWELRRWLRPMVVWAMEANLPLLVATSPRTTPCDLASCRPFQRVVPCSTGCRGPCPKGHCRIRQGFALRPRSILQKIRTLFEISRCCRG